MLALNTIHRLDCIEAMRQLDAGCIDLVFADPPFNIGYDYDVYTTQGLRALPRLVAASGSARVHRVLKPDGTFWLAIGDEYAAELKIESARSSAFTAAVGSIWYYTFGVNCKTQVQPLARAPVSLREGPEAVHVSARTSWKTAFRRPGSSSMATAAAIPTAGCRTTRGFCGRRTWPIGFTPDEDTWYFPRVAGTFKERAGFHGCQMPEQLLGRIIRICSHEGELVLDPFSGSATTLAVAKKLGPEVRRLRHQRGVHHARFEPPLQNRIGRCTGRRSRTQGQRPGNADERNQERETDPIYCCDE